MRARRLGILFVAETRRYLLESYRYLANYVTDWLTTALIISVFALSAGDKNDPSYWVGLLIWTSVGNIITEACISLSADKQNGTFRQLMAKPTSMFTQITVKTCVWTLINTALYIVFCLILFPLLGYPLGFNAQALLVIIVVLIGAFGFTLILSALTVLYTKISNVAGLINYLLLLVSGAVLPLSMLPAPLAWLGRLLPTTLGIDMARRSIRGATLTAHDWLILAAQSAIYLIIGYAVFLLVMRHGRRRGINMRY
jgi:ABC-2 type transport system permease protein